MTSKQQRLLGKGKKQKYQSGCYGRYSRIDDTPCRHGNSKKTILSNRAHTIVADDI